MLILGMLRKKGNIYKLRKAWQVTTEYLWRHIVQDLCDVVWIAQLFYFSLESDQNLTIIGNVSVTVRLIISKSKVYCKSPLLTPWLQHGVASTFLSPYILSNTLSLSEESVVSASYIP